MGRTTAAVLLLSLLVMVSARPEARWPRSGLSGCCSSSRPHPSCPPCSTPTVVPPTCERQCGDSFTVPCHQQCPTELVFPSGLEG